MKDRVPYVNVLVWRYCTSQWWSWYISCILPNIISDGYSKVTV